MQELNIAPRVLFYTKLLPPAFGGYVTAGVNLYRLLSKFGQTALVTDETLDCLLDANERFDLLIFNATYEDSSVFDKLIRLCDQVWVYEHNIIRPPYRQEMCHRISLASRVVVPSPFLKNALWASMRKKEGDRIVEPDIIPLPVDALTFRFQPHMMDSCIRFCSFCAIKPVRKLEQSIRLVRQLHMDGHSCCYHIYGSVPFQGDMGYYQELKALISQLQMERNIEIRAAILTPDQIAETMRTYDFYLDLSEHETYGQAKLEAIFSGLGIVMTSCENDLSLLPKSSEFYDGGIESVSEKLYQRFEACRADFAVELQNRKAAKSYADAYFSDTAVGVILEKMYYESI